MTGRPVPIPDETSAPYWQAASRHTLTVARCGRCATLMMPPDVVCRSCGSSDPCFEFIRVTGRGVVRSWIVVRHTLLAGIDVPFVLVDVELDEPGGVRLIGRLLDGVDTSVRLGDRVRVVFEAVTGEISVPAFELAR